MQLMFFPDLGDLLLPGRALLVFVLAYCVIQSLITRAESIRPAWFVFAISTVVFAASAPIQLLLGPYARVPWDWLWYAVFNAVIWTPAGALALLTLRSRSGQSTSFLPRLLLSSACVLEVWAAGVLLLIGMVALFTLLE